MQPINGDEEIIFLDDLGCKSSKLDNAVKYTAFTVSIITIVKTVIGFITYIIDLL